MAQVAQPRTDLSRTWQDQGACLDVESDDFFPPALPETSAERDAREARAKVICARCDVRRECLDWSLAIQEPHGVWGGLGEVERRKILAGRLRAS